MEYRNSTSTRHHDFVSLLIVLAVIGLLASCASQTPIPEDHYYLLPDISPDKKFTSNLFTGTLGVSPLRAFGLHNERALLFIDYQKPLELSRYHYHHWVDSPGYLIQEHMVSYLRATNLGKNIVRYEAGKPVDALLRGRLLRFERVLRQDGIVVIVSIELDYEQKSGLHRLHWLKEYIVSIPAKGVAVHETIQAFGLALQSVYDSFLTDFNAKSKESSMLSIKE